VDGKIKASSGILKPQGSNVKGKGELEKRLIVVEGLENAKELILSGRFLTPPGGFQGLFWTDQKIYTDK